VETVQVLDEWALEREIFYLIADKWALLIVKSLGPGTLRFTQLKGEVGSISHKMLTQTLRGLERNGIVDRHVHPTVPPRVDYTLTAPGHELLAAVVQICGWTRAHRAAIVQARDSFDRSRTNVG
jgi:DNA-binding HxlR family transcriptional regulator